MYFFFLGGGSCTITVLLAPPIVKKYCSTRHTYTNTQTLTCIYLCCLTFSIICVQCNIDHDISPLYDYIAVSFIRSQLVYTIHWWNFDCARFVQKWRFFRGYLVIFLAIRSWHTAEKLKSGPFGIFSSVFFGVVIPLHINCIVWHFRP